MFVLLDNSSGTGSPSLLFTQPRAMVVANEPGEVVPALTRIEAALAAGQYAVGFLAYELGYALEPRLAARMPVRRSVPLLCFGLFGEPRPLSEQEVLDLLATAGGQADLSWIVPDFNKPSSN